MTRGRNLLKIRWPKASRQCPHTFIGACSRAAAAVMSFPVCLWQLGAASLHGALEGWPPYVHYLVAVQGCLATRTARGRVQHTTRGGVWRSDNDHSALPTAKGNPSTVRALSQKATQRWLSLSPSAEQHSVLRLLLACSVCLRMMTEWLRALQLRTHHLTSASTADYFDFILRYFLQLSKAPFGAFHRIWPNFSPSF